MVSFPLFIGLGFSPLLWSLDFLVFTDSSNLGPQVIFSVEIFLFSYRVTCIALKLNIFTIGDPMAYEDKENMDYVFKGFVTHKPY